MQRFCEKILHHARQIDIQLVPKAPQFLTDEGRQRIAHNADLHAQFIRIGHCIVKSDRGTVQICMIIAKELILRVLLPPLTAASEARDFLRELL